jgi:hypothetical protein
VLLGHESIATTTIYTHLTEPTRASLRKLLDKVMSDIAELARRRVAGDRQYWDPGYAKSKPEGVPQRDVASRPEAAPRHDPEWLWSTIRNAARGG